MDHTLFWKDGTVIKVVIVFLRAKQETCSVADFLIKRTP